MFLGKVIGNIVSTQKHFSYNNKKILLVHPMHPDGSENPKTMVAVDTVGAGTGDIVLVASEGRSATEILKFKKRQPLRSVVVAIVDEVHWTEAV
jgi:ethanolamine utilization protein EutN